jgi:hypothetical protein
LLYAKEKFPQLLGYREASLGSSHTIIEASRSSFTHHLAHASEVRTRCETCSSGDWRASTFVCLTNSSKKRAIGREKGETAVYHTSSLRIYCTSEHVNERHNMACTRRDRRHDNRSVKSCIRCHTRFSPLLEPQDVAAKVATRERPWLDRLLKPRHGCQRNRYSHGHNESGRVGVTTRQAV